MWINSILDLMLYQFRKHNNVTNVTNDLNAVYPGVLDTRTCFKKFNTDDFNLFDYEI